MKKQRRLRFLGYASGDVFAWGFCGSDEVVGARKPFSVGREFVDWDLGIGGVD